jgi:hypothetical protein
MERRGARIHKVATLAARFDRNAAGAAPSVP